MTEDKIDTQKRRFFSQMITGMGGAVALTLTSETEADELPHEPQDNKKSVGYHETEHIRSYYKKASF